MNAIDVTQLIFSPDDVSGTCYEHSTAEGIALVQVIEKSLEAIKKDRAAEEGEVPECATDSATLEWPQPEKLTWKIDAAICKAIETATINMDKWGLLPSILHFWYLELFYFPIH